MEPERHSRGTALHVLLFELLECLHWAKEPLDWAKATLPYKQMFVKPAGLQILTTGLRIVDFLSEDKISNQSCTAKESLCLSMPIEILSSSYVIIPF